MQSPGKEEQSLNAEDSMVFSDSENTTFVSAEQPEKEDEGIDVIPGIFTLSILLQPSNHEPPPLFFVQSGKINSPASAEQLAKHPMGMLGIFNVRG